MRVDGERHWIPLGTEREGWNDVRAADRRDEIASLIRRGAWRPPNTFELDPREKNPGFHEFASDWLKRYRRTVDESTADTAEYMLSHHLLPFLHTYRLDEIDYAVLSAYVAHKLERNEEIEAARDVGVTLGTELVAPAIAQPTHDQHDARPHRAHLQRRGQAWAAARAIPRPTATCD